MPRFFLHLHSDAGRVEDREGEDHPTQSAARIRAIEGLRDVVAADASRGRINLETCVEIADLNGATLLMVMFKDAISLRF